MGGPHFENLVMIKLHNTKSGKVESFSPIKKGHVGIYVCGITPYDEVHLGHARCYVVFDLLRRVFRYFDYKVNYIQNFTNVDDKIIDRASKESIPPIEFADRYIESYFNWMDMLNIERADAYPKVTEKMNIIIDLIRRLVKEGVAYEKNGDVFFSVRKFPDYGKLSRRNIEELESGARVEVDEKKNDPLDFALWKKSKPGEPEWDSPWGKGRPGWHIECSAMSMEALGDTFDIHGGGQDLIFPHHENEVAQSLGAIKKKDGFARVWIHNGFVTINREKMSKSLGNFFTLKDILKKSAPMGVRYFLLTTHYKAPLHFSDQDLDAAETTWKNRIQPAYELSKEWGNKNNGNTKIVLPKEFEQALADDLNTPKALGILNTTCSKIFDEEKKSQGISTETRKELFKYIRGMLDVLGLKPTEEAWDKTILELVHQREKAREEKKWAESDRLRDELLKRGVVVEDSSKGPRLKKK